MALPLSRCLQKALAEAAGADEEEKLVGPFHFVDEPCLIDIVTVVFADSHEVHHTVGYAFYLLLYLSFLHNRDTFDFGWLKYDILFVRQNFIFRIMHEMGRQPISDRCVRPILCIRGTRRMNDQNSSTVTY